MKRTVATGAVYGAAGQPAGGSASPSRSAPLHDPSGLVVTRAPPKIVKPRSSSSGAPAGRSVSGTPIAVPPKIESTWDRTRQPSGTAICRPPYIVRTCRVAPDGSSVAPRRSTSWPANHVITRPRRSAGATLTNRSPAKIAAAVGSFDAGSSGASMRRFANAAATADPDPRSVDAATRSAKARMTPRTSRPIEHLPAVMLLRPASPGNGARDPRQSTHGRWTRAGGRVGERRPGGRGPAAARARPDG